MWNCLWGHALKRFPGINRKSRVSYPGPGFYLVLHGLCCRKKHYNGLINQSIKTSFVRPCSSERYFLWYFDWIIFCIMIGYATFVHPFTDDLSFTLNLVSYCNTSNSHGILNECILVRIYPMKKINIFIIYTYLVRKCWTVHNLVNLFHSGLYHFVRLLFLAYCVDGIVRIEGSIFRFHVEADSILVTHDITFTWSRWTVDRLIDDLWFTDARYSHHSNTHNVLLIALDLYNGYNPKCCIHHNKQSIILTRWQGSDIL